MDWLSSTSVRDLRLQAMHDVVREPEVYNLRHIFRWYSQTFHTPLHLVEHLPIQDILQHYYETQYEDLDPIQRRTEIEYLLLSPAVLQIRRMEEDAEDAEAWEFAQQAAAAAEHRKPVEEPERPVHPIDERIAKLRADLKPPEEIPAPETQLPAGSKLPEGFSIQFQDWNEDAPGFGPPEKPKG